MTDAFVHLAGTSRWLIWREETRGGRPTKVPYAVGGGHASATDPSTWRTRREAEAFARRFLNGSAGGIGIVLGNIGADTYLCGLDLDSCIDDGLIDDWAAAILDSAASYAEISPSGRGVKTLFYVDGARVRPFLDCIGVAADAWGCRRSIGSNSADHGPAVEVYCNARYFAVTGNHWAKTPDRITRVNDATLSDLAALIPQRSSPNERNDSGRDDSRSAAALPRWNAPSS